MFRQNDGQSNQSLEVTLLDLKHNRTRHYNIPLDLLLRREQNSSNLAHSRPRADVIDPNRKISDIDPLIGMSQQHMFGLSVVGRAPAFSGEESIANHHVFALLSVVVIPRCADHLPIGLFIHQTTFTRYGSLEEILPEVFALAPPRLRMLCPELFIRCYLIQRIEVLYLQGSDFDKFADECGL